MSWKVPKISHENFVRTLINAKISLDKISKDLEKDIIYVDNLLAPTLSTLSRLVFLCTNDNQSVDDAF